jgi:putative hydrolase of the HAD superfamily
MIDAILFDLDGVIRIYREEHSSAIEAMYSLPLGSIGRAALASDLLLQVTTGILSRRQWITAVGKAIGCPQAAEAWNTRPVEIDTEVLAVLSDLKSRLIPTYLLTNGTDNLRAELLDLRLNDMFVGIFNSAELRVAKPAPEIFQIAIQEMNCLPNRIAYIDDLEINIASAKSLGINALRYTSVTELRNWLSELRVIST